MNSPHLCKCGCGDNVATANAFVPGHENTKVAREYREEKTKALQSLRAERKQNRVQLPPHFGPKEGGDKFFGEHTPVPARAPYFGRKLGAKY